MKNLICQEMKKYEKTITVYTLPFGFKVEVEKNEELSEFYISHNDYGVKMHMFGLLNCDISDLDDIVASNVIQYIALYHQQYITE